MAIVDNVALYALGYAAHESHPIRLDQYCLNTIQRKYPCSDCVDACPKNIAIDAKEINWHGCTNCNLCVTACPTQAIHESSASLDSALANAGSAGDVVVVACDRYEGQANVRTYCLSSVPWELIAALALKKPVVLKVKACRDCENADLRDGVHDLLNNLKRFFGPEEFKKRIFSRVPEGAVAGSGASKRTALEGAMSTVKRGAEELLTDDGEERRVSHYRAILLEMLQEMPPADRPDVTWLTLTEDGNCRGCEICSKMCPHGAIELRIPEYEAEQKKRDIEREAKRRKAPGFSSAASKGAASTSAAFTFGPVGSAATAKLSSKEIEAAKDAALAAVDAELAKAKAAGVAQAFVHDASRCTQCGLCYMSCPEENIGGWAEVATSEVPAKVEHSISVTLCEKCGRPFKPKADETKCAACGRRNFLR